MENTSPYKHEHQDPHTPEHTSLFLGMLKDGGRSPLPSGCLQLPPANSSHSSLWLHPLFIKQPLGMDQPAVGILQVCVQLLIFIQRLRGSEGQLSKESR